MVTIIATIMATVILAFIGLVGVFVVTYPWAILPIVGVVGIGFLIYRSSIPDKLA